MAITTSEEDITVIRASSDYSDGSWWLGVVHGIALILLGIFIVVAPIQTFVAALFFIGIFAFIAGVTDIILGLVHITRGGILSLLVGILGVLLGIFIFKYPSSTAYTLIFLTGIWLIVAGFVRVFRTTTPGMRGLEIFSGILNIIIGILLLNKPIVNGVIFFWIFGLFALIDGSVQIAMAIHQRNMGNKITAI